MKTRQYELNIPGIAGGLEFSERCVLDYLCEVVTENRESFAALLDGPRKDKPRYNNPEWWRARNWDALVAAQAVHSGEPYAIWDSPEAVRVMCSGVTCKVAIDQTDVLHYVADLILYYTSELHALLGKEKTDDLRYHRLAEAIFIAELVSAAGGDDTGTEKEKIRVQHTNQIWSAKANRRLSHFISTETRRTKAA